MEEKIIKVKSCGECPLLSKVYGSKQGFYYQCDANKRIKKFDKDLLHDKCPLPPNNNEDDLTTAYMYAYQQAKYKYKPRWRKYPEEKPEKNGTYLCKYESGFCYECEYSVDEFINPHTLASVDKLITHWMPIPDLED